MIRIRVIAVMLFAATLFAMASGRATAQETRSIHVRGGFALATTSYSKVAAERNNTVGRSFGLHSIIEPRLYDVIGFPLVVGWEYLGPICIDWEDSTSCNVGSEKQTSLLFASAGAAFYGPPIPIRLDRRDKGARAFIVAGREWVSRAIGDDGCLNCILDSVRFSGGLFIEPGLELPTGSRLSAAFSYRVYRRGAELENRFVLRFSSRGAFWR